MPCQSGPAKPAPRRWLLVIGRYALLAAILLLGAYLLARRRMQIRLGIMRTRRMLWQQDRQRRKRG